MFGCAVCVLINIVLWKTKQILIVKIRAADVIIIPDLLGTDDNNKNTDDGKTSFQELKKVFHNRRVLNIRSRVLGSHPDTAKSRSQLGLLYHAQTKYDEALIEHKKALDISIEILSDNHPEVCLQFF
jgi:hypothetical protein